MRKTILIVAITCMISVSFAFIRANTPRYENLKVLPKNTTKKELDSIMKHFSMSLGVKCTHCHVRGNDAQKNFDFASDDNKNKLVARSMFKMMNKINKKYFKNDNDQDNRVNNIPEVSCYSCHRGKEDPENKPPVPTPAPGGAVPEHKS